MSSSRNALILASLAAVAAVPGVRRASADIIGPKDELAQGDWRGVQKWDHLEGTPPPAPVTTPATTPPSSGGTPTPPPSGEPSSTSGTPTVPSGTNEEPPESPEPADPDPSGEPEPTSPDSPPPCDPDEPTPPPPPPPPPPAPPVPTTPAVNACNARWTFSVREPNAGLYEELTALTITLFRTDVFAFICSGYCRSESTWYLDAFATTTAGHEGQTSFLVDLRLENPCPNCQPRISLKGVSSIEAKAQAKTPWGGVNSSTTAVATASTSWAGDIHCEDRCSATVADGQGTGEISVGAEPLKVTQTTTKSLVRVEARGGKGDAARVNQARTSLLIVDDGSVFTSAHGTDDNAQAKSRVGYHLVMEGDSSCGKWGHYEVSIKE